ncbi:hypothetical protein H0X48_05140 [Candidatus Dependentiae bacterium]|nr:hypothetical protein [Candidatus Dependentiae bacterium]
MKKQFLTLSLLVSFASYHYAVDMVDCAAKARIYAANPTQANQLAFATDFATLSDDEKMLLTEALQDEGVLLPLPTQTTNTQNNRAVSSGKEELVDNKSKAETAAAGSEEQSQDLKVFFTCLQAYNSYKETNIELLSTGRTSNPMLMQLIGIMTEKYEALSSADRREANRDCLGFLGKTFDDFSKELPKALVTPARRTSFDGMNSNSNGSGFSSINQNNNSELSVSEHLDTFGTDQLKKLVITYISMITELQSDKKRLREENNQLREMMGLSPQTSPQNSPKAQRKF